VSPAKSAPIILVSHYDDFGARAVSGTYTIPLAFPLWPRISPEVGHTLWLGPAAAARHLLGIPWAGQVILTSQNRLAEKLQTSFVICFLCPCARSQLGDLQIPCVTRNAALPTRRIYHYTLSRSVWGCATTPLRRCVADEIRPPTFSYRHYSTPS
jgi:hypothetical protein